MRAFSVSTLLVVVFLAAGCGGGGGGGGGGGSTQASGRATEAPLQVLKDAQRAAEAASSVRISGQLAQSGKHVGVDLSLARDKGATGSLTLNGAKLELVVIGNQAYMRASPAFWKQFSGVSGIGQLLAGKWLKFPTDNAQLGSITSLTNDKAFFKNLGSHGKLVNKGATTYNGQSVVAIQDVTQGGTLYVLASGTPYPVSLAKARGSNGGAITFDNWNQSVTLTAPKGAVDISQLGSQLGGG